MTSERCAEHLFAGLNTQQPIKNSHCICSFPGLNANDTFDELMNLLKLLTSQSPDAQIVAQIALEGGYDPCANSSGAKRKKRSTSSLCDEGFSADNTNRICYKSTGISQYQSDGIVTCNNNYNGDLVVFYNDSFAQGFLPLLKSGKSISLGWSIESRALNFICINSQDSSIGSILAWYWGVPWFKFWPERDFFSVKISNWSIWIWIRL